jgi:CspA family cold shock protein
MPTGTVKFFNAAKGYGFIAPEGGGNDVFVHVSELERSGIHTLNDGERVSFDTRMDEKKGILRIGPWVTCCSKDECAVDRVG